MTIPNTTLTDESLLRPFEGGNCRTVERVAIGYEDDIETVCSLLTESAEDIDGILDDPAPRAGVDELADDAVVLGVHYWIDDPRQNSSTVRSAFARTVKERLQGAGVDISPASKHDLEGRIQIDNAA